MTRGGERDKRKGDTKGMRKVFSLIPSFSLSIGFLFPALYHHILYRTMTVLSLWGKLFFHIVKNTILSELIVKGEVHRADHVAVVATAVAVSKTSFQNWRSTPVLRGMLFLKKFLKEDEVHSSFVVSHFFSQYCQKEIFLSELLSSFFCFLCFFIFFDWKWDTVVR